MLKRNISKTTFAQTLIIIINIISGLVYTPYLLSKIGPEAYAFYPLSFNMINLASILTVIFTSMLSKYITVHYIEKDYLRVNEYFNSSLAGNIIICIVIGIPMLVGSFFIDRFLDVPKSISLVVKFHFFFIVLSFFIIQIRNNFMVSNIVAEKRYLTTYQRLIEKVLIIILPVILFSFLKPSLIYLGIGVFIAVNIRLYITYKTQRKILPEMVVKREFVKPKVVTKIVSGGMWHAFNQLVTFLYTNVEILLANIIFGSVIQAEYSIAVIIPNLIRSMLIYVINAVLPNLTVLLSSENPEEMRKKVPLLLKCMSIIMGILISIVIGFGDVFLQIWIPKFYSYSMYILMSLSALSVMVSGSFSILYAILASYDKVKIPAIIMFFLGVVNIPLSYIISKYLGIYGILISSLIINLTGYFILFPIYSKVVLKLSRKKLYPASLHGMIALIMGLGIATLYKVIVFPKSFLSLISGVIILIGILVPLGAFKAIDKDDRLFIKDIFNIADKL